MKSILKSQTSQDLFESASLTARVPGLRREGLGANAADTRLRYLVKSHLVPSSYSLEALEGRIILKGDLRLPPPPPPLLPPALQCDQESECGVTRALSLCSR